MPFTPLHLGLGTVAKAVLKRRFSFMIFGGTQVLMDIEPLLGMLYGWQELHRHTHNLIGAMLIGTLAMFIGKPISAFILKYKHFEHWQISWRVAAGSAFFGSFSHVLLDGLMHHDMSPFYPISNSQFLLDLIPYAWLFYICIGTLMMGGIICLFQTKLLKNTLLKNKS